MRWSIIVCKLILNKGKFIMKYLILLLSLFMVSNVNAYDVNTPEGIQKFINYCIQACKYNMFPDYTNKMQRAIICKRAALAINEEVKSNYSQSLVNEGLSYDIKSCRLYWEPKNCNTYKEMYYKYCTNCGYGYKDCEKEKQISCAILEDIFK